MLTESYFRDLMLGQLRNKAYRIENFTYDQLTQFVYQETGYTGMYSDLFIAFWNSLFADNNFAKCINLIRSEADGQYLYNYKPATIG